MNKDSLSLTIQKRSRERSERKSQYQIERFGVVRLGRYIYLRMKMSYERALFVDFYFKLDKVKF